MTEKEWLECISSVPMLALIRRTDPRPFPAYERKLRLFACACCRYVWNLLKSGTVHKCVEAAEAYADGLCSAASMLELQRAIQTTDGWVWCATGLDIAVCLKQTAAKRYAVPLSVQADLLREIVGNPWKRPVFNPTWLTPTVKSIADSTYSERVPHTCPVCSGNKHVFVCFQCRREYTSDEYLCMECSGALQTKMCLRCHGSGTIFDGALDVANVNALTDALEDAGCDSEELLNHFRGQPCQHCKDADFRVSDSGYVASVRMQQYFASKCICKGTRRTACSHVRGCWALDLVRGVS